MLAGTRQSVNLELKSTVIDRGCFAVALFTAFVLQLDETCIM